MKLEKENCNDFEKKSTSRRTLINAQAVDENDLTHATMIEFQTLLKTSGGEEATEPFKMITRAEG